MTDTSTMSRNKNCNTEIRIVYREPSIAIRIALQQFCIATALVEWRCDEKYTNCTDEGICKECSN